MKTRLKNVGKIKPIHLKVSTHNGCALVPPSNALVKSKSTKNIEQIMKTPYIAKNKSKSKTMFNKDTKAKKKSKVKTLMKKSK